MPQTPLPVRSESNIGVATTLNVSTQTVVKATQGVVYKAAIVNYGTAAPVLYDANVIANAGTLNEVCALGTTATAGTVAVEWPFLTGIIVNPNGGTICLSYS